MVHLSPISLFILFIHCVLYAQSTFAQTTTPSTDQVTRKLELPSAKIVKNMGVSVELVSLELQNKLAGISPSQANHQFLIANITIQNVIDPELVFDHEIAEEIVYYGFPILGPFLHWNGESIIGTSAQLQSGPDAFPDPAILSFEGDQLTGNFVFEVPTDLPDNGAALIFPHPVFGQLNLELFNQSADFSLVPENYQSANELYLNIENTKITDASVAVTLSGFEAKGKPIITAEDGTGGEFKNQSGMVLFIDRERVMPLYPNDSNPIVFFQDRTTKHEIIFPTELAQSAVDIGLVVPLPPSADQSAEPYWIIPLKGNPSIAEIKQEWLALPAAANTEDSTGAKAESSASSDIAVPAVEEPPFAPPWPEPPEVIALHDGVVNDAMVSLAKLESAQFSEISPGGDDTDAVVLPVDQVVGSSFTGSQKYHVYLLNPLDDPNQLTELSLWSEQPKKIKLQLYDVVGDKYGEELARRNAQTPLSRLRIQRPTLLYVSKTGGDQDYRLMWRTTQKLEPAQEYEPNSIRTTGKSLIANLPKMQSIGESEFHFSGFIEAPDKIDYFVLETEEASFVTLEASDGTLGIYIGDEYYTSKVVDKRVFLADILVLPGRNVFYIHRIKGDYTVKATATPLSDRWHELEPNDSPHLAHRLPIGQVRTGRLPIAKDYDYYFFDWPSTGLLRFSAEAGEGGDLSLWLYRDGVELKEFAAAEIISEPFELEAGTYELLVFTYNPSLQPYSVRVEAENPNQLETESTALSISILADTAFAEPFSSKGQVINGVARVQNESAEIIQSMLRAHTSHDGILVDIPEAEFSISANSSVDVPFQIRVRRSAFAVGEVPLFFNAENESASASTQWHLSFPYDAAPTPQVWHDQPLPAEFMGAFDVAHSGFGAFVHRDISCRCTPKLAKATTTVYGTATYHLRSGLCPAAVHAGEITTDGGLIRVVSGPVIEKYIGSERNGVESKDGKPSANSFHFIATDGVNEDSVMECEKSFTLHRTGSEHPFSGLPFRSYFHGESLAVNLVGEQPVDISGVILSLLGTGKNQVRDFAIDVSDDGLKFENVFSGQLILNDQLQPFVFERPVSAKYARIRLLSGFTDVAAEKLRLSSFRVMALKDKSLVLDTAINLADPQLGAHVFREAQGHTVISFHHNRLALVQEVKVESKESKATSSVSVQVSESSPYGPWTVIANEQLKPKSSITMSLDEPVKARYLRLSGNWTKAGKVKVASVIEAPSEDIYRSILAEWGNQESDAYFELGIAPTASIDAARISSSAEIPYEVISGDKINSTVSLPLDLSDYFRVSVPSNTLSMQLVFSGDIKRTQIDVTDVNGEAIEYSATSSSGGQMITLTVSPLLDVDTFFVKVYDRPKYLAVLWDDSGSVSPYVAGLHRMLRNFAFDVDPRFEKINLMSLYDANETPKFLLDTWAESPYRLLSAIRSYVNTGSSSAYFNMEFALGELDKEEGVKALLIMTDEQGDRNKFPDNKMEKLLNQSDVAIFSFHATSSKELHDINANHMQTWADIGGGRYTFIRSKDEVPSAIAKVQSWLRKPAVYEMQVAAIANTPGTLNIVSDSASEQESSDIVAGAVEVILDASGSMWKKMADGQPRIVVAKEVLLELVADKLPENLPFAMRVFGNRKAKSCRTDLELPLGPLSKKQAIEKIKSINPQDRSKTPIGASLSAVTTDLKKAQGRRIVILITDGEETCDADPKAVIADLKSRGVDVQVNIVGFAINDDALKAEFAEWASIGGGDYFDTNDAEQLISSLQESLVPQFTIQNNSGEVVAEGRLNGPGVELLPGEYSVQLVVEGYEPKLVTVQPGGVANVRF